MAIASQTSSTIIFEPQGSASGAVASDRPNGIAYHELELFIWKLPAAEARPLEDWIRLLREIFGQPPEAALAINDSLMIGDLSFRIDCTRIYRLVTNGSRAAEMALALDPSKSELTMLPIGTSPTQLWYFSLVPDREPSHYAYWIRNIVRGDDYSVDVINDNDTESRSLNFTNTGRYTGQFWSIRSWESDSRIGGNREHSDFRLTNDFTGLKRCFSVDNEPTGFKAKLRDLTDATEEMRWSIIDVGELRLLKEDKED